VAPAVPDGAGPDAKAVDAELAMAVEDVWAAAPAAPPPNTVAAAAAEAAAAAVPPARQPDGTTDATVRVYADLVNKAAALAATLCAAAFAAAYTRQVENTFDEVSDRIKWDPFVSFQKAVDRRDAFVDGVPPAPPQ